jgi:DNA-binding transcriptional regulator YiaG
MLALAEAQDLYQKTMTELRKEELAVIKSDMTEPEKKLIRQQLQVARDQLATEVNRVYLDVLKMDRDGVFKD